MASDIEIMDMGINCLLKGLGAVETERFISVINRERFDYTKWQEKRFAHVSLDEFHEAAVGYAKENPFRKEQ